MILILASQTMQNAVLGIRAVLGMRKLSLAVMVMAIAGLNVCAQQPSFLTNGLVAYYPFNGNANDESGNGYGLSLPGIAYTTNHLGQSRSAAIFTQDYAAPMSAYIPSGTFRSISYWYNLSSFLGTTPSIWGWGQVPVISYTGLPGLGWGLNAASQSSWNPTRLGYGEAWIDSGNGLGFYLLPITGWHFLTCVMNGDVSAANVYIDGTLTPLAQFSGYQTMLVTGNQPVFTTGIDPSNAFSAYRVWNRGLTSNEVALLYQFESVPHALPHRQATVTSQIINGFVVGVTITDGGFGYTNAPAVVFTGGGGTGAIATSAINTNGSVTSITVLNPGHGYTTAPTVVIAPPPFPPRQATANVQLANGFIVGAPLTDGGFGYSAPPRVRFIGGRGSLAAASSAIDFNGVVTGITVTNPGSGYNTNVQVVIDAPFIPNPTMTVAAINFGSLVTPIIQLDFGHLAPYNNYQIEFSPVAAGTWTNVGTYFIPTATTSTQFINATGKVGFFRVKYVP